MDFINDKNGPAPCGNYSHAVKSGKTLYISGQVPFDPQTGELIGKNISEQTEQAMKNLLSLLESAGIGIKNIVKTTVYLTCWDDFTGFDKAYGVAMNGHKPARATVAVNSIAKGALIEIDAIAEIE